MAKKKKTDVSGSETVFEKLRESTPWIFGEKLRKPKIKFPRTEKLRIRLPAPSKSFWLIAIFIVLFILQMGVVYFIYREPPSIGADQQGQPLFIWPDLNESFIVEGIVASIFLFLASSGFLLLYQASKYVYNRKIALRILIIGVILIVVSFIVLQLMLGIKAQTFEAGQR
ncbi:MAG: OST3 / OST6 family protein [Promethearchaeota archaeon]|nr:MAG: OST3 / OST6 family protein [Candidatus Lokiarchaeota archaeon]